MTIVESLLELVKLRAPKPRRPPTARDEAIFALVKVLGRTQAAVAADMGLTQPRISQIVSRVQVWRQSEDYAKGSEDRQRGDRELDRQRLEEAHLRGMRAQEKTERAIVSERSGERDGKPWSEKSSREQPASVQGLKAALRAMEMMWKLEDRPQKFVHQKNSVEQLHEAIQQLHYVRRCALAYGGVQSTEPVEETVQRLLEELVRPTPAPQREDPAPEQSPDEPAFSDEAQALRAAMPEEERIANKLYGLGVDVAGLDPEVKAALLAPTREAPKRCVTAPQPRPDDSSWKYVPVKMPDISVPLTTAQREARRKLMPRMELVEYDERGNKVQRS